MAAVKPGRPTSEVFKACERALIKAGRHRQAANMERIVCHFNNPAIGPLSASELVAVVSAATGWETGLWELMKSSSRRL